jgi:hypothetical protein
MAFPLSSLTGDVKWATVQVEHARGWSLNLPNDVQAFRTNKTKGRQARQAGGIDATGSFNVYSTDDALPFLSGQKGRLQLYINATQFWDIDEAIIISVSPEVDIEGGTLQGFAVEWGFAGKDDATWGKITAPDLTEINLTLLGIS